MKLSALPIIIISIVFILSGCGYEEDSSYSANGEFYVDDQQAARGENYIVYEENPFVDVSLTPISTFSIDADGASYANMRRFIMDENQMPPKAAIRTEELINYFQLDYPYEDDSHPIALNGEVSSCPWTTEHKLIRIGIKGKPIDKNELPASNFVLLIDVSGSMDKPNKLGFLQEGFNRFVDQKKPEDRVAIVTYAGSSRLALQSTTDPSRIKAAINELTSGGSTAGAEGILTAYEIAAQNFISNGNNRVILGTDGDFNVGVSSTEELVSLIETKRDEGIFLTVLGVGRGNLNDGMMEQLANNGNGNYEYLDKSEEMDKVFIHEFSKFYTVAKDVKVQVEFNPTFVEAYRLIGYENRLLQEEDFEDDNKDAGEIGSNQNVTALYEIIPKETEVNFRMEPTFTIDFRYKEPDSDKSNPMELEIYDEGYSFANSSDFMQFTANIAGFSMVLTDSPYKGDATYDKVLDWLDDVSLNDPYGRTSEFEEIVISARGL